MSGEINDNNSETAAKPKAAAEPSEEAMLVDLEVQWKDHWHMRDQTWKTLFNTVLFLLAVIGAQFRMGTDPALLAGYIGVLVTSVVGIFVTGHHRSAQKRKFDIIREYEKKLKLSGVKSSFLAARHSWFSTATFVMFLYVAVIGVAIVQLISLSTRWAMNFGR